MNKLIESIKLVPKFSHQYGHKSEYETNINFIDKNVKSVWTNGHKDNISYTYDCLNNNKRSTSGNYYHKLFEEIKIINRLLKHCPDFDVQIKKNRGRYFFDFIGKELYSTC